MPLQGPCRRAASTWGRDAQLGLRADRSLALWSPVARRPRARVKSRGPGPSGEEPRASPALPALPPAGRVPGDLAAGRAEGAALTHPEGALRSGWEGGALAPRVIPRPQPPPVGSRQSHSN